MKRLASTLYASHAAIIVICVASIAIYAGVALRGHFMAELASRTEVQAKLVRQRFMSIPPELRPERSNSICREMTEASGTRFTILDQNGEVLGDSSSDPASMDNHGSRPEVVDAFEKGIGQSIRFSKTVKKQMFYLALPISVNGRVVGVVRAAVSDEEVSLRLNRIYLALALGALIAAIVALFVGGLLARAITKPLREMETAARSLGGGKLDARVLVTTDDELGMMGATFNEMAEDLQRNIGELAAERNEREAILASMREGVVSVDSDGALVFANDALRDMLGLSKDNVEGKVFIEVVRSAPLAEFLKQAQASQAPLEGEVTVHRPVERVLSLHARPLQGGKGRRIGTLIVGRDVTRIRRLEEMRNVFVSNVSHELKTPITLIKGCAETLLDGAMKDRKTATQFLCTIKEHADRMNAIVDDLLQLSALEAGEEKGERVVTDLAVLAKRVTKTFQDAAAKRGIELTIKAPQSPVSVLANELLLEQAVSNLVDNAVKYTNKGGRVVVEVSSTADKAVLSVADDGIGIEKRHLAHVFERFYRVDNARSRELGGTGLGLSIVKHITATHGGNVSVESQPGRGSRFTVCLPTC